MIPGLDEMLLAHAKQHGLERIDIGVCHDGSFIATVWWKLIGHEIPCTSKRGKSVADAIGKALDDADAIRSETVAIRHASLGAVA